MIGCEKILIPQKIAEVGRRFLLDRGYELVEGVAEDEEALKENIKDCSAVLLRTMQLRAELLRAAPKLKIVARHGAGYDNVDWKEAEKLGIYVTNTPFVTNISVAEFTLGAMINCAKRIYDCSQELHKGNFAYKNQHKGMELFGKKLGILGLGGIGKEVARRAYCGLDMDIQAYIPRPEGKEIPEYVKCVSKEELFSTSDIISVHIPGNRENRGFISEKEFMQMKRGALLINVSRGGVVDEEALVTAVETHRIAGAAVDVFQQEPPRKDDKLLKTPGIFVTPHMASNTESCMEQMALKAAEEIHRVLMGRDPLYAVNRPNTDRKDDTAGGN